MSSEGAARREWCRGLTAALGGRAVDPLLATSEMACHHGLLSLGDADAYMGRMMMQLHPAGSLFLEDQCKVINLCVEEISVEHLPSLAEQCAKAAEPLIGGAQARLLGGIIRNFNAMQA